MRVGLTTYDFEARQFQNWLMKHTIGLKILIWQKFYKPWLIQV